MISPRISTDSSPVDTNSPGGIESFIKVFLHYQKGRLCMYFCLFLIVVEV
jgi:hypothetical protein